VSARMAGLLTEFRRSGYRPSMIGMGDIPGVQTQTNRLEKRIAI
jgi:hypothetical protein